eukprot:8507601-Pyramimonas_sp.AAC.1
MCSLYSVAASSCAPPESRSSGPPCLPSSQGNWCAPSGSTTGCCLSPYTHSTSARMLAGSEVSSPVESRTLSSWCRSPDSKRYLCARFGDCVSITWNCLSLFSLPSLSCVLNMCFLSLDELASASFSLSCSSVGVASE